MATVSRTKTWSTGETLTAAALNAEFDGVLSGINSNSLNQANLSKTDDYTFGSVIVGTGITSADGGQLHVFSGDASVVAHVDADEGVFESNGNAGISILAGATSNSAIYFGDTDNDIAKIDYDHNNNDFLLASGGTITLDAETDIVLDANGADIFLKDAGTEFGKLINNSGELRIASGSSSTTALSFAGANATFAGTVGSGAITSTGIIKTDDATEATSTTDGSLQTDGGLSVVKDAIFGDDVRLLSDSAILSLGAGNDATLTHDGTTGVTIEANPITITSGGAATWSTSSGALTVTSAAALNLNPASGSAIVLDGTISVDAGVVTGATSITLSGELDAGSLDISGNADIDGTLEADAYTVDGATLAEYITDTTGAMFSSNTESGITVTFQDGDNTIDLSVDAAQTGITSLLATDIKIGEDDETKIDFESANEIHFYAGSALAITIDGNGAVGIGTAPERFLHLKDANPTIRFEDENDGAQDYDICVDGHGISIRDVNASEAYRLTIDEGGKVGIGTAVPTGLLHLFDANNEEPKLVIENTSGDSNSGQLDFYKNSGSEAANDALGMVNFYGKDDGDNKTKFSYISSASAVITGGAESGQMQFGILKANAWHSAMRFEPSEVIFNDDSVDVDFRIESDNDANAFFVQGSDGNVGIGTATPLGNLHVQESAVTVTDGIDGDGDNLIVMNNGASGISVISSDTTAGKLIFGSASDKMGASIAWYHNSNEMYIGTNHDDATLSLRTGQSAEGIHIDENQNVGVGTSAPDLISNSNYPNVLTVFGSTTGNDRASLELVSRRSGAASEVGRLSFWNSEAAGNRLIAGIIAETAESGESYATESGQLGFYTTTTASSGSGVFTERMRINSDGNVGINHNDPGAKLTIKAGGTSAQEVIKIHNSENTTKVVLGMDNSAKGQINFFGSGVIQTQGKTDQLFIASDGNVGINTGTPGEKLTIKAGGTTGQEIIKIRDSGDTEKIVLGLDSSGYGQILFNPDVGVLMTTGNANHLVLDTDGNVGIGTATFGSSAAKVLAIANGTAPSSSPADAVQLYANDVSSSSKLRLRDEAGNDTVISPHDFGGRVPSEPMAWAYHSTSGKEKKTITVDMLRVVRVLEQLSGEQLVYIEEAA